MSKSVMRSPISIFVFLIGLCSFTITSGQPYNKKLIVQLDTIAQTDQQYRSAEVQRAAKNQQEDDENMRKQDTIDQTNLAKIEKIIATYGYPGKSLVGEKHQSTAFLVIQHSDLEAQERYLPILTDAVKKGELRASSLGILVDRVRVGRGKEQMYGSQMRETKQGVKLLPIEDEMNVNKRRAQIGLPPLEEYLQHWHINYKVPTAAYQNPDSIYYKASVRTESPVNLIGGNTELYKKLMCPAQARQQKIVGSVTVQVTVDKNGLPKEVSIVKTLGYGCDEEALRVMKEAKFTNTSGEDQDIRMKLPFTCNK